MKGLAKSIKRTPHMVTTKIGMSKKSNDPEFDDHSRHFATLETATEKLLKDTKAFTDSTSSLFTAGEGFATHFSTMFRAFNGEYDLAGKYPDSVRTMKNMDAYEGMMGELKSAVEPELELISSRIVGPTKELKDVLKAVRKSITKREHKLVDYDRFNNSLTKLREKKEKTLNDEKNLFKLEQDFEIASNEYEYINNALKDDLPKFMVLATRFIDPLFHSFFYMQLNIYYMLLEKLSGFAEGNYDVSLPGNQIATDYEEKRSDAWSQIEDMSIVKRIVSTSKMVQSRRTLNTSGTDSSLGRSPSTATSSSANSYVSRTTLPPPRSPSSSSIGAYKKPPPPPVSSNSSAPPPPYSPGSGPLNGGGLGMKKAPPPPPPVKPKPKSEPPVQYVVALYDFDAQAEGDLDFKAGDRIEVIVKTDSSEDWWTGKLNGRQGVFPGNYVQDT